MKLPNLLKKFVFAFFAFLILFGSVAPNFLLAHAADPITQEVNDIYNLWNHKWYSEQNPFAWYDKVYNDQTSPDSEIFGERYTAAQVQWVIYGLFSFLWNFIPGNPQLTTCILAAGTDIANCNDLINKYYDVLNPFNISDSSTNSNTAGIFSVIGQNPISGIYYFKNLTSKFTLVTPVSAQGTGFTAANSVISLWRVSRNISYALMVIVVIVMAFMIMFQVKINPQVVISIQSALPRLIFALLLVTFSYAIAGLAIDLMYVVIGILSAFLSGGDLSSMTAPQLFQDFITRNSFTLMYSYWIHFLWASVTTMLSGYGLGILVFLFAIFAILAVLWWSLKIIWVIIKNFALIILTIALGPLEIMLGAVTEASGFATWFKRLLSYLAVYPMMCLMFFLAFFFLQQGDNTAASFAAHTPFNPAVNLIGDNTWIPPLSFATSSGARLIWILVSFVIFSEIPKVAELTQGLIAGKQYQFGTGMGEAEGRAGGALETYSRLSSEGILPKGGTRTQTIMNALKWLLLAVPK